MQLLGYGSYGRVQQETGWHKVEKPKKFHK